MDVEAGQGGSARGDVQGVSAPDTRGELRRPQQQQQTQQQSVVSLVAAATGASNDMDTAEGPPQVGGSSTSSICPTREMRALADVVNGKCAGSGGDILDPEAEDMEEIDDDFVRVDVTLDETHEELDQTRCLDIRDLVGSEIDVGAGGQLRVGETVPFIVLKFDPRVDKAWTVPDPELFTELMNIVQGHCYERKLNCQRAYRWATLWGKVGLLGLASRNVKVLTDYREAVEDQLSGQIYFVPKGCSGEERQSYRPAAGKFQDI